MCRKSHLTELFCPGDINIPTSTLNAHSVTLTQAGTADDVSDDQAIGTLSGQADAHGTVMVMQATGDQCSIIMADDALDRILCHHAASACIAACRLAHSIGLDTVHWLLVYTAVSVACLSLAVWSVV